MRRPSDELGNPYEPVRMNVLVLLSDSGLTVRLDEPIRSRVSTVTTGSYGTFARSAVDASSVDRPSSIPPTYRAVRPDLTVRTVLIVWKETTVRWVRALVIVCTDRLSIPIRTVFRLRTVWTDLTVWLFWILRPICRGRTIRLHFPRWRDCIVRSGRTIRPVSIVLPDVLGGTVLQIRSSCPNKSAETVLRVRRVR